MAPIVAHFNRCPISYFYPYTINLTNEKLVDLE
jgi:hypothetical protein